MYVIFEQKNNILGLGDTCTVLQTGRATPTHAVANNYIDGQVEMKFMSVYVRMSASAIRAEEL